MIATILTTAAGTLAASHYGPWVWKWLNTKEPGVLATFQKMEHRAEALSELAALDGEHLFAEAYGAFKSNLQPVITEGETVVTEVEQTIVTKLQAVFSSKDQAIANLQAELANLQKQLSDAETAHADFVNSVSALAGS